MQDLSLKQLEAFVAVAESGSFSLAAKQLFLSQSTVSAHVAALETLLGERLFHRGSAGAGLTPAGEQAYAAAKKILGQCRDLEQLFRSGQDDGPLLLGASTVPGQYLLPGVLSAFLQKNPDVHYQLRRGDSAAIHALMGQEVRLGFVGAMLAPESNHYLPIAEDKLVLVTENSPHFRAMQQQGVWGRELLGLPTVAREEGSGTDRMVRHYLSAMGFPMEELRVIARVDDPEAIKHMVQRGVGVSVLSAMAVADEVASGKLLAFDMDSEGLKRDIYLIYRRDAHLTAAERSFIAFVQRQSAVWYRKNR